MSTVGRPPRKRSPKAGRGVGVKGHKRSPRGRNSGKGAVTVKPYQRGKPKG